MLITLFIGFIVFVVVVIQLFTKDGTYDEYYADDEVESYKDGCPPEKTEMVLSALKEKFIQLVLYNKDYIDNLYKEDFSEEQFPKALFSYIENIRFKELMWVEYFTIKFPRTYRNEMGGIEYRKTIRFEWTKDHAIYLRIENGKLQSIDIIDIVYTD